MVDARTWDVARFEFLRFFNPKSELIGLGILLVIALVKFGGEILMSYAGESAMRVAIEVPSDDYLKVVTGASAGPYKFLVVPRRDRQKYLESVRRGLIGALVVVNSDSKKYDLFAQNRFGGIDDLKAELSPYHQRWLATEYGLNGLQIDALFRSPEFDFHVAGSEKDQRSGDLYKTAIAIMVLTLFGVMGALTVVMEGIAGEKYGKISEMVLTSIPVQVWIDGKLLAATTHGLKIMFFYSLYVLLGAFVLSFVAKAELVAMFSEPNSMLLLVAFSLLGLAFWSVVFTVIATMMSSPAQSVRNMFTMIPITVMVLCIGGTQSPNNSFMVFLSMFPVSSMFAMPVRLMRGSVQSWQVWIAILLIIASIVSLRRLASRIFVHSSMDVHSSTKARDYVKYLFKHQYP
jgi:ABC-2 type transport system permease protein